jgi:WD40 repeat protein
MKTLQWILLSFTVILGACVWRSAPQPAISAPSVTSAAAPRQSMPTTPDSASRPPAVERGASLEEASPIPLVTLNRDRTGLIARPVDVKTLADVSGYAPVNLRHHYTGALSPDGRLWAVITWPTSWGIGGILHLIDLREWTDTPTSLSFDQAVTLMAFSPDGARLVVADSRSQGGKLLGKLWIIDPREPGDARSIDLEFIPRQMQFSLDGQKLFVYGDRWQSQRVADSPLLVAFETGSGATLWSLPLEEVKHGRYPAPATDDPDQTYFYQPGIVFSPDGRWLYLVHPDEDRLTRVDLTAGSLRTANIVEPLSWFDRLMRWTAATAYAKGLTNGAEKSAALSPDGTRLYIVGHRREVLRSDNASEGAEVQYIPLGLEVVAPQSGKRLMKLDPMMAAKVLLSPDGRWLYLMHDRATLGALDEASSDPPGLEVLDAETLEPVAQFAPGADYVNLDFSQDGARAYVTWQTGQPSSVRIEVLDVAQSKRLAGRSIDGWIGSLILPSR